MACRVDGKEYPFQLHRMVCYCFVEAFDLHDSNIIIKAEGDGLDIRPQKLLKVDTHSLSHRLYETGRQLSPFSYEDYDLAHRLSPTGKAPLPQVSQYDPEGKHLRTYQNVTEAENVSGISIKDIRYSAK